MRVGGSVDVSRVVGVPPSSRPDEGRDLGLALVLGGDDEDVGRGLGTGGPAEQDPGGAEERAVGGRSVGLARTACGGACGRGALRPSVPSRFALTETDQ